MKIGIVSPWYERGIAFVSLGMYQALTRHHEVHVLAPLGPKPRSEEFHIKNLARGKGQYKFPYEWASERELDALLFNERLDCRQLFPLREHFRLIGLLQWEFVPDTRKGVGWINRCYHGVIAPTYAAWRYYTDIGIRNVYYCRWGVDLDKFKPPDKPRTGPLRFLQPSNFGGLFGRKNVKATRAAWGQASVGGAELLIHNQNHDPKTRAEMAEMYRRFDVALLPSQWEGLGLCFIEALASGMAIVTVDAPPMSEYVADGWNGLLCEPTMMAPLGDRMHVRRAMISVKEYTEKMEWMARNPDEVREMGRRSRLRAVAHHDWYKNGARLCRAVEEVLDGVG